MPSSFRFQRPWSTQSQIVLGPAPRDGGVLAALHVRHRPVALVVGRTRRVARLDRALAGDEVLARAGLVAVAPDHDGRVVLVALDHREVARHRRLLPALLVRQRLGAVAVAVRFDVRLVAEVDAVHVAEVVPVVVLRVVRVAHGVAVRLLEHPDVLLVARLRHEVAVQRVGLVAVGALELDLLPVEEVAAVADLAHAEAEHGRHPLGAVVQDDLVARRRLRAPGLHVRHGERLRGERTRHEVALPVVDARLDLALGLDRHLPDARVAPGHGRLRGEEEVADARLRAREHPRAAEDAREAEHVLVLEVAAVGIAVDLERDEVLLAGPDERRHVELRGRAAVLREADVFAVHPKVEEAVDAVELEEDVPALPVRRHRERAAVAADRVARGVAGEVLRRHAHHLRPAGHVAREGIADVGVHRRPPAALPVGAVGLPGAGDLDRRPGGGVEVGPVEADRALGGVARPVEAPGRVRVEADLPRRVLRQDLQRLLGGIEAAEGRAHGFAPLRQPLVVLPFRARGPRRRGRERPRERGNKEGVLHKPLFYHILPLR